MRALLYASIPLALVACNRYDLFRVAGHQQETFTNRADVLFVIDNSDSMVEEAESLAVNFATFINELETVEDTRTFDGLGDAVANYVDEVTLRTQFVDYSFAVTNTDPDRTEGRIEEVIRRTDDDVPTRFIRELTCKNTCFTASSALPAAPPGYSCGDPLGGFLTQDYLDCTCGEDDWQGNCSGTGIEEGLESVFLAMCRAVPNPPTACFEDGVNSEGIKYFSPIREGATLSNEGLLRDNANMIVVVVTDEGDSSRRLGREEIPVEYERLFAQFGDRRMTWVFIGPGQDETGDVVCPGTATNFAVTRYAYMAFTTGGRVIDIFDSSCDTKDFDGPLGELGELLTNLLTAFPLQSVPVPGTITVVVDGKNVGEAENLGAGLFGLDEFSDGWSYQSSDNSIKFWGAAIPPYDSNVEVFYQPIDGIPRDLPF
ncbi:MAG: hypothetical protein KTR31_15675 [Myxococcales bacterium]|nr:hypothetical protein [Myxococcales bacterium]